MPNLEQAARNRAEIAEIKRKYVSGEINREEAQLLAQPILDRINTRSAEIAKQHGKKSYPRLTFMEAMRNNC